MKELGFDDILPHLASAYRRGILVPFIGSGMSVPTCTGWLRFLLNLSKEAGVKVPQRAKDEKPNPPLESADYYRLADKAVVGLSSYGTEKRIRAYRKALNNEGKHEGHWIIPHQTEALARCSWPLVLTTNYDDLFIASRMKQSSPGEMAGKSRTGSAARLQEEQLDETDIPEVLGRSVEDCHQVVRSLDSPTRPILWALQGFVGGQAAPLSQLEEHGVLDKPRRLALASQMVVGHQQYQHAINAHAHFRRAFAEVLSRRSLLFLGSGILEDYLVNLFGEISHHYGPGPHPHFALFIRSKEQTLDIQFLQKRLGIVPIFYEDHGDLPQMLGRLTDAVWHPRSPAPPKASRPVAWMPDELGFSLSDGLQQPEGSSRRLRLRYAPLKPPTAGNGECVILSVGRRPDNVPIHGSQARDFLDSAHRQRLIRDTGAHRWKAFGKEEHSYAFRFAKAPIFAVAARIPSKSKTLRRRRNEPEDERRLDVIESAVATALRAADRAGFRHVCIGPVASGKFRLWDPIHPFVQTLAGIRRFFDEDEDPGIQLIDLHVFAPSVWLAIVAGKVPVMEILSSKVMKIRVNVRDPSGDSETFAVTSSSPTHVGQLEELCGLVPDRWSAEVLPLMSLEGSSTEDDLLITPTSRVVLTPRKRGRTS
ncbi:SIR2 family protein [Hyalangium versicolor]|uniref:SIR2 family protein n=1 Tax=Hyalangium versicolor TaxID=2861190 RepID=UPI001CCDC8FA|nr:SIR2 family protein [Hyalangium versicolor]